MKSVVAFALIAVVAIVAFNRALGPSVDLDTPVFVHDADPIKVLLPANPDAEIISGYVYSALAEAAQTANGSLERHLSAMSTDSSLLDWIARSGAARFSSGDAAALAYPLYRATVAADRVDITTATIELLPAYWAIGNSIAHEDGHALINEMLATECGSSIVADHVTGGARGSSLERAIETSLYDLGNEAHERYHEVVNGSRSPRYTEAARNAVAVLIEAGC